MLLSDVGWATRMLPVLTMLVEQAQIMAQQQSGSADHLKALEQAVGELREAVGQARAEGASVGLWVAQRLAEATPEQAQRWVRESGATAVRLAREARARNDVTRWRASLLFAHHQLWAGALGRDPRQLAGDDYLPLVQEVFGFDVPTVTPEHLTRLDAHITALRDASQRITVDALVRREAFTHVEQRPLTPGIEERIAAVVTGDPTARWERRLELRSLIWALHELRQSGQPAFGFDDALLDDFRRLDRVVDSVYRHYDKHRDGERPLRPVDLGDLTMLLRHKYGDRVAVTWREVSRIADRVIERENSLIPRWLVGLARDGAVRVGLSRTRMYRRKVAAAVRAAEKLPGRTDSPQARGYERNALWQVITTALPTAPVTTVRGSSGFMQSLAVTLPDQAAPIHVSEADLDALVRARRKHYSDPRDRRFRSQSDYASMVLEILGRSGPVSAADVVLVAQAVRRAHSLPQVGRRMAGTVRAALVDGVLAGWHRDMPGPRPAPSESDVTPDHSRLVTAFHTIGPMGFAGPLTGWLNGIVPFADGAISTTVVEQKLTSLFGQALDDGSDIPVDAGGRTFDVRVWAVPTAPPQVRHDSLLPFKSPGSSRFAGKQENRIYRYLDAAQSLARSAGWSIDAGVAYRAGLDPPKPSSLGLANGELALTGGYATSSGSRQLSGVARSDYQFLRIKEPLGWVDLPVNWVARVQDRATGRWQDFTWLGEDGRPRADTVAYSVAQFQLPYTVNEVSTLDAALADNVDPGYLQARSITAPEQFPLWDLDHAVSRIQLAEKVLTQLRLARTQQGEPVLSVADYLFWKPVLEAYVTNDTVAMGLADVLRPPAGRDFQQVFRVVLERDGRRLSLALSADAAQPITSVTPISEVSRSGETRFDRILAVVAKSLLSRDLSKTVRLTMPGRLRFLDKIFSVGLRGQYSPWRRGEQHTRNHRAWLTRAKRVVGRLQVVLLDFTVRLDVTHATDGGPTKTGTSAIDGYAHAMVAAADLRRLGLANEAKLDTHRAEDLAEDTAIRDRRSRDATKTWWNLGAGFGLGMDFLERLSGVDQLYNEIVTVLVERDYLPTEARGGEGRTPWEVLQQLPLTGATLNRPGPQYRNWLSLVEQLSERALRTRGDDLLDMDANEWGVTLTFPSPTEPTNRSRDLVVGVWAQVSGAGRHDGVPGYQVQYGHTSVDAMSGKRTSGQTAEVSGYVGVDLLSLHTDDLEEGLPLRGQAGGQYSNFRTQRFGRTQSTALTSDTDGQKMPSARYLVPIRWHWAAERNAIRIAAGSFDGQATLLQPDELHDRPDAMDHPALRGSDGEPPDLPGAAPTEQAGPSVLMDMAAAIYTVVGATGVGDLRAAVVAQEAGIESAPARRDLTKSVYKAAALRGLAGAATIPVGGQELSLATEPVGRPRVEKVWFPYSQQVVESQAGKEQSREAGAFGGWSVVGGVGVPYIGAAVNRARDTGAGTAGADLYTVGSYRGVYQDKRMAVVRTAVVNVVTLPSGRVVRRNGELVLNVLLHDVVVRADEFDDPGGLLAPYRTGSPDQIRPALVRALGTDFDAPVSVQHGFSWSVTWPLLYGGAVSLAVPSRLTTELAHAAERVGGPELALQVRSLPTWLSPNMPKLRDGGARWEFSVGSRRFEVFVTAELEGPARAAREGGSGEKLYARGNQYRDSASKDIGTATRGAGLVGSGTGGATEHSEGIAATVNVSGSQTTRVDGSATRGSNLLFMVGLRANKLRDFNQAVTFHYRVREIVGAWNTVGDKGRALIHRPVPPRVIRGSVTEEQVVAAPAEGSLPRGQAPLGAGLLLRDVLPDGYRLTGIYGLQNIFTAVKETAGARERDVAGIPVADDQLTFENFPDRLPAMFTAQGSRIRAVATADKVVDRNGADIRVKAQFGPMQQLYFMEKAENERYDHGTDQAAMAETVNEQTKQEIAGNLTVIPADPAAMGRLGPRVVYSYQRGQTTATERTDWIEHRAWLRSDTSVYFIYTTLTFDVIVGGRQVRTSGAVELAVDQQGALQLGIPLGMLKAVVPQALWAKEFPGDSTPALPTPAHRSSLSARRVHADVVRRYRDAVDALHRLVEDDAEYEAFPELASPVLVRTAQQGIDPIVERDYSFLSLVNPYRNLLEDAATNCVIAAIATDVALAEGAVVMAPPTTMEPARHLENYRGRPPVRVPDLRTIVSAMAQAPLNSRGMVVVNLPDRPYAHVFNAVHDGNGVVFLDGQAGDLAEVPTGEVELFFLPTTDGIEVDGPSWAFRGQLGATHEFAPDSSADPAGPAADSSAAELAGTREARVGEPNADDGPPSVTDIADAAPPSVTDIVGAAPAPAEPLLSATAEIADSDVPLAVGASEGLVGPGDAAAAPAEPLLSATAEIADSDVPLAVG
ncbi:toxin glutamine deamidase domain-containing protein, partial [Dactylosporangium sp. NPDC005572]|uniref:toxin glutamine deamidase domain-containing protein n=1 Tax=Dactylosporangium sp. NPDC005572 TaxID=3156889 RepID=UPI0033AC7740